MRLAFLEHPLYTLAHPGEPCDPGEQCTKCCVAIRQDTNEKVLLWLAGEKEWTVSRHDPNFEKHQDLRECVLTVSTLD